MRWNGFWISWRADLPNRMEAGAPAGWAQYTLGQYLMENYVNKAEWPDDAYSDIADYLISSWEEAAGL